MKLGQAGPLLVLLNFPLFYFSVDTLQLHPHLFRVFCPVLSDTDFQFLRPPSPLFFPLTRSFVANLGRLEEAECFRRFPPAKSTSASLTMGFLVDFFALVLPGLFPSAPS